MRQSRPGSVVRPQYAASFDCEAHARGEPAPALLRVALFEDDLNKTYSLGFGGSDVESAAPFGVAVPSSGVSPTEASKPLESKHKWEGRKELRGAPHCVLRVSGVLQSCDWGVCTAPYGRIHREL